MLYQNFRSTAHPSRYEVPYIGRNAVLRQLAMKEEELENSKTELQRQESHLNRLRELRKPIFSMMKTSKICLICGLNFNLPKIENEWKRLTQELGSLDFSYLEQIEKALFDVDSELKLVNQIRQMEKKLGSFEEAKENKEKEF